MIKYFTGNLLDSNSDVLVNTVNCEGFMGKGIAYQFKLHFPKNNEDYIKACKNGSLKIGKLHYFTENGKIIINFPTKEKWRSNSKMEYIEKGLDELVKLILKLNVKSVAIPPLGSGNGGLYWSEVKQTIESKLKHVSDNIDFVLYEPSQSYRVQPILEPKLTLSALILMQIKNKLLKFDCFRLQKTAFLVNLYAHEEYFKFSRHKFGPYDNSIFIISKSIKEYQKYHHVKNTEEAYNILYNKLISCKVENKLHFLNPCVEKATNIVNLINNNHLLESITTILFLLKERHDLSERQIIKYFKEWSEDKENRFSVEAIRKGIETLNNLDLIDETLTGYCISNTI